MKPEYSDRYLELGLKIAYYRKMRGLTQEQLAEKIGRNPAYVGHIEAPNLLRAISLDTLFDIAYVLEVPPYKFLISESDETLV
ncbi:MAG: helix-turn-helix domain-containing protein [Candidatus Merdivicinus sp.]|jgi:transcriptional regulator with XRE-family HTH domain